MKQKEFVKWLLPIVAVVVIIESVVLITGLDKRKQTVAPPVISEPVVIDEVESEPKIGLSFATQSREMEAGEKMMVEVNATALEGVAVDAIDLYIDYDPELVRIANLKFADGLPKPTFSKVSEEKKVVVANFLEVEPGGVVLSEGQVMPILTMEVTAVKEGLASMQFATGKSDPDSVTMFIENKTSRSIPLTVSGLEIEIK